MIYEDLPSEKVKGLRYLYIVLDSEYKIHYEFNNRGHIILPIHKSEILPWRIYKNLPRNLIKKCESDKKNIVGVLQLWIYYTRDYAFARIRAIGVLDTFKGNKYKAILRLVKAMDEFCDYYKISYVDCATSVIPHKIMRKAGFEVALRRNFLHKFVQFLFRQTNYVKRYNL